MNNTNEANSNESLKFEKVKFWVSVSKWVIGSVAIVVIALVINSGFKERVTGIQEMQAFDKYVDVILKADNIEERWKLCQFFSTVTPTERLRDKWINYKHLIQPDYDTFKKLKQKEFELNQEIQKKKSPKTIDKLNEVRRQLEPFQKKLVTPLNSNDNIQESGGSTSNNLKNKVEKFKETLKKDAVLDPRYKMAEYFKKINDTYNSVVGKLIKELGDPYQSIQTGINYDYKESTFSNQYGIISKFDKNKKILPALQAKFTTKSVIITLKDNEKTDSFISPITNIQWDKIEQFIRTYFVKRLNQLK